MNTRGQTMKKITTVIIPVISVIIIAVITGISIYNTPENRINRHLNLGQKYLEEQNYEQALVEFNKAIAIDSRNTYAYLGIAQVYEGMIQETAEGYIYDKYFDDFDGDGKNEMFALVFSDNLPNESMEKGETGLYCTDWTLEDITAGLYFVNEDGARIAGDIIGMYDTHLNIEELEFGKQKCILTEKQRQEESERYLYAFYEDEVIQTNITNLDVFGTMHDFEHKIEDGILYVKSEYCLQFDKNYKENYIRVIQNSNVAGYSAWIPFVYHVGTLYEHELIEISQKDFMKYNGAGQILNNIANGQYDLKFEIGTDGMEECELHNILFNGTDHFYINYVYTGDDVYQTLPAYVAEAVMQDGKLTLADVRLGMQFKKSSILPGYLTDGDGEIEYLEPTEENRWIKQLLDESDLSLIDYCYDDFNGDGEYELLGLMSKVAGSSESMAYNDRKYFQEFLEVWQVNKHGCHVTDITMQETSLDTWYNGFEILPFASEKQIELLDETVAHAGDYYCGIVIAVDDSGDFYKALEPSGALVGIDGAVYYFSGTETIDTPYYGTGFDASLDYPICFLDNNYYEMASVEIDEDILNKIDNWDKVQYEIEKALSENDSWQNCWRSYACKGAEITEIYFNETGKIYINYRGIDDTLDDAIMINYDGVHHPDSYVTAELTMRGNHIESYEILAGKRQTNATGFEIIISDASKLFR